MWIRGRFISDKDYILIDSHTLNIPQRLKEIDSGYFLLLNRWTGNFEVHHIENKGNTHCVTSPYDELDQRLLDYVRKTRIENASKIFEEMKKNNEKIKQSRRNDFNDYIGEVAKDIYQYAAQSHKSREASLTRKVV